MKLTIVIVNYNVQHFLEQCLYSVRKAIEQLNVEVIVVDNNSVDGSVAMVREKFPEVNTIVNKRNTGFAYANNQAIKIAKGEYVLLLNPDTVVEEDTFKKMLSFMNSHPDAGGLGVKMLDGKGNYLPESKRGLPTPSVAFYKIFGFSSIFPKSKIFGKYHLGYLDKNKTHQVDVLSGACMLLRKSVLDKIGLLDETFFMYGEDIDLSYRIVLAGYKNYYFADTRIIHYKGESTKKSSINYVLVFYKAMTIFAQKHFSNNNAKTVTLLINLAIYLRAAVAIVMRFFRRLSLPAVDFALIIAGLYIIKEYYERNIRFISGGSYSEVLVSFAFTSYAIIWLTTVFLSGGYDKPIKLYRIIRGVVVGTGVILIIYSLLPEAYRFSRALILLGMAWVSLSLLSSRILFHLLRIKGFDLNPNRNKHIAIIGTLSEYNRVRDLLKLTSLTTDFIDFISIDDKDKGAINYLGDSSQIKDLIEIYKIDEVIFCSRDISSQNIIEYMHTLVTADIDFKIAPPESLSIIGSNSINTAGDLYIIDVNAISKPKNKRNKRMFDIASSIFFLISSPILIWFQTNKFNYLKNGLLVLAGVKSWVGYGINEFNQDHLPKIKPSVLSPADVFTKRKLDADTRNRLNLNYSKDYRVENDLNCVWKCLTLLGQ